MATNELIDKKKIIKNLKEQLSDIKKYKGEMDLASWGYEQGVLITGNEAKQIIMALESQAKEPSDEDIEIFYPSEVGQAVIMESNMTYDQTRLANYYRRQGAKAMRDGKIKTQTK